MTIVESRLRLASDPAGLEATEALLERFPDIDEAETKRIAAFIRSGSSLDIGLLSSNQPAWAKVETLRADRPELFRMSARGWVSVAVMAAFTAGIIWMLYALAAR